MLPSDLFVVVRGETEADTAHVRRINREAFGRDAEADLVETLGRNGKSVLSLVAEVEDRVVGHILFTRVAIEAPKGSLGGLGLAPVAVLPDLQRRGVGSMLIRAGLHRCRSEGHGAVLVLGHPSYYPRFGFVPAARFGLRWEHEAPEGTFMALELRAGALKDGEGGLVKFQPEFATA